MLGRRTIRKSDRKELTSPLKPERFGSNAFLRELQKYQDWPHRDAETSFEDATDKRDGWVDHYTHPSLG